MSEGSDISVLYREFADALTEVLAENAAGPVRRGRLARARASAKRDFLLQTSVGAYGTTDHWWQRYYYYWYCHL